MGYLHPHCELRIPRFVEFGHTLDTGELSLSTGKYCGSKNVDYNSIADETLNSKPPTPWEVEFVDADGEPSKAGRAREV